jgi:predicted permease
MSRRKDLLRQLERDIRDHIERETLDNEARGMPPEEARYAALRKFGNIQQIKEQTRAVWTVVTLEHFCQDVRYGLRTLYRNPGFAAAAILSLALGIGVNTAIFSVINRVLLIPLPYPNAARMVSLANGISPSSGEHFKPGIEGADFAEWQAKTTSFDKMAGYDYRDETLSGANAAYRVRVALVTGDFWAMTGTHAALGRLFSRGDSQNSIVLTHHLFEQQFKGDPAILRKVVTLDGKPVMITGVLPPDFRFLFPQHWRNLGTADVGAFVPAPPLLRGRPFRLSVVATLKPLVPMRSALAELQDLEAVILKTYPDRWFPGLARMALLPLQNELAGNSRQALLILQVAGVFVLLIACANIANLLLARAAARSHEIAIRTAIGAGAERVLKQVLTEGIVLALLGGSAGLLVAKWTLALIVRLGTNAVPRLAETRMDWHVSAFTLGLSLVSGILFSFAPAISLCRAKPINALKDETRNSSVGLGGVRLRQILVASELALAMVLLAGAGLMLKSFWKMYANPAGFAPENTLVLKVSLSGAQYADRPGQVAYIQELLRRIGSLPGVEASGIANIEGYLLQSKDSSVPNIVDSFQESLVSPGYFQAIGMRLLKGRWLRASDPPDATIINETMARRVFGNRDPLGRRIDKLGRKVLVVGVVRNLKYSKRDEEPGPELFRAYSPNLWGGATTLMVAVRVRGDPLGIAFTVRGRISRIDPAQPVYDIESLEQLLADSVASRRLNLFLLGTFAAAALLMALVGVYGVIAYSVTQRTREIGIRMALGAQRSEVVRMMIAQGMGMALAGIAAGLGAALGLTRFMADDPPTFAVIALMLAVTVLLASWGPALKAALLDPLAALRYE